MSTLKKVVYLTDEQYATLLETGSVVVDDKEYFYDPNNLYLTPYTSAKIIHANSDTTERSYAIPNLTSQQVIDAYNSVIAGLSTYITNADGTIYYMVSQADSYDGSVNIRILYFAHMIVTYTEENDAVTISSEALYHGGFPAFDQFGKGLVLEGDTVKTLVVDEMTEEDLEEVLAELD